MVGGLLLSALSACGDDGDDTSSDAGTPEAGKGSGGKGGSSGKSGAGGSAGKAGAGGAGKAGAPAGGSGGQSSAGDDKITIRFKAKVGDQDFACNKSYSGIGSKSTTIKPMDFRFFVQDVKLIDDKDKEVPVKLEVRAPWQSETVALLDFEDGTGLCSSEGNSETNLTLTGTVPKGTYKAISSSMVCPRTSTTTIRPRKRIRSRPTPA